MHLIEKYIVSMANLYGTFSIEDLLELYNTHHEEQINEEAVYGIRNLEEHLEAHYVYPEDGMFIAQAVYPEGFSIELLEEKLKHPTYLPTKQELLRYMDEDYIEPCEALDDWTSFVGTYGNDQCQANFHDVIASSFIALKMGWKADAALRDLEQSGYRFSQGKRKQASRLLKMFKRHIRRWEYNGHTLAELETMNRPKRKIGRNEPCPCGSGKKYKHCCLNK